MKKKSKQRPIQRIPTRKLLSSIREDMQRLAEAAKSKKD